MSDKGLLNLCTWGFFSSSQSEGADFAFHTVLRYLQDGTLPRHVWRTEHQRQMRWFRWSAAAWFKRRRFSQVSVSHSFVISDRQQVGYFHRSLSGSNWTWMNFCSQYHVSMPILLTEKTPPQWAWSNVGCCGTRSLCACVFTVRTPCVAFTFSSDFSQFWHSRESNLVLQPSIPVWQILL